VSDLAVGCAASRFLNTTNFVQVSAKRDPAGSRHRSDPGSDTSGLRANENLSVQFPRGQSVRKICTHEQHGGRNVSSLVGRPSCRAGARACAPGAASDRMGKRRTAPYSRFGPPRHRPPLTSPLYFLLSPLSAAGRASAGWCKRPIPDRRRPRAPRRLSTFPVGEP